MYYKFSVIFFYVIYSCNVIHKGFSNHIVCFTFVQYFPSQTSFFHHQDNSPLKTKGLVQNIVFKEGKLTGTIIPTSFNFFTKVGLSLGLAHSLSRSISRVLLENNAWKKRCRMSLKRTYDLHINGRVSPPNFTSVEFICVRNFKEEQHSTIKGCKLLSIKNNKSTSKDCAVKRIECEFMSSSYLYKSVPIKMDHIREFEEKYNIPYDPYYDEPYQFDQLPKNSNYTVDKFFGDIHYNDGEIFYRDISSSKNHIKEGVYWRQGGRPRIKFLGIF